MSYRDLETKQAPGWLQQANGAKFLGELGGVKDDMLDRARQAVLVNLLGTGPADALPSVGAERQLPQGAGETDEDYAERMRTAWDAPDGWSFAGSHGSLLRALVRAGFPDGVTGTNILQTTKRYAYLDTGAVVYGTKSGWTFGDARRWNRFGIVFGADVAGLTVGSPLANTLNSTVALWKPAKALYVGAWVMVSGVAWGWPLGITWGQLGLTWGASGTVRFIPAP